MKLRKLINLVNIYFLSLIFSAIGIYAFLASDVTKVDVSGGAPGVPVIVPENYKNLLVLDVVIPPAKNIEIDPMLQNGLAGSSPGDDLNLFAATDWYSDHNGNMKFDGNQESSENEVTIFSSDEILDSGDIVKNTGLAMIRAFKYSAGVYEQYIDSDHSNSYTTGEAVVRTASSGEIRLGEVIRGGAGDMNPFPSNERFIDDGVLAPAKYRDGEAIILDNEPAGILSDADTVMTQGAANLKPFPENIIYPDSNNNGAYERDEAIISDNGAQGKLDSADTVIRSGKASLTRFSKERSELFSDNNGNGKFDPDELAVADASKDLKVTVDEVKLPGLANLKSMGGDGFLFADDNRNALFDAPELIVKNTGNPDILESADVVIKPGKADLKPFADGLERFIDNSKNGIYDDGECIIRDAGTKGVVEQGEIEMPGKALLQPFSGRNYLFTDASKDGKWTGGSAQEAIFGDINVNGLIDSGELIAPGYADIKPFPAKLWFIEGESSSKNGSYDNNEAMIISEDDRLSTTDIVAKPGPAFLTAFAAGSMKWADANNNIQYDDDELIAGSADNILSFGEVITPGYCGLKPFPDSYLSYVYADSDNNDKYSKNKDGVYELIVKSTDKILDAGDTVIKPGTANLLPLKDTSTLYIDGNASNNFESEEPIVNNSDPVERMVVLDASDEVLRSGIADIKSFGDEMVYIDNNNDARFHGDSDSDVVWDKLGDPTSINDPDIISDQDEVLLSDPVGQKHLSIDDGDIVLRPGMALLTNFQATDMFTDNGNSEYDGGGANEAIIQDSNANGILDSTDTVMAAGSALIKDFAGELFIDDNNDTNYTEGEAVWKDSGTQVNLLDAGDEILKSGKAALYSMKAYRYMNDGAHSGFSGVEAIITDKNPAGVLDSSDVVIRPGTASIKAFAASEKYVDCNGDGKYTDGEPIVREKTVLNPGKLANFTSNIRYIDSDNSGFYSADGSPLKKTSAEAVIKDNGDRELGAGQLDGTGIDKIIVPGIANIKPIGAYGNMLVPPNPQINAFLDRNRDNLLSDYEVLITDNNPAGILDSSDKVWGKIDRISDDNSDGNYEYYWSGVSLAKPIGAFKPDPPDPRINAYIDAGSDGSPSNYDLLITDNPPVGTLDSGDIILGEIKNKNTGEWNANLADLPWRLLLRGFQASEKFISGDSSSYEGQPVLSETPGTVENVWDESDLMVYEGTPPRTFNGNWAATKYVDDNHDNLYNMGECVLNSSDTNMDSADKVVTAGKAGISEFQSTVKLIDCSPQNALFDPNEAIIGDNDSDDRLDAGEVIMSGNAGFNKLKTPVKYIDSNRDGKLSADEAIIRDGGQSGVLDAGALNGIDQVLLSGAANMRRFSRAEKFIDGNRNKIYDAGEAIVYDWYDQNTFKGEFILAGNHVDKNGSLTYLATGARTRDCVLLPSNTGRAAMIELNDRAEQKYIDNDHSGSYNGFYVVWGGKDYEPILRSDDNILDKGKFDGSGTDNLLAAGYCMRSWKNNMKWADSNHDGKYQINEAIVFDAGGVNGDGIISSTGDDKVIVPGEADLNDFTYMKYVDANSNNTVDIGEELIVKDGDQDNKVNNDEICDPGVIPFLRPFVSDDYRYCDWDHDGAFAPQEEAIIYTPINPNILEPGDKIISSGNYACLTAFDPQPMFIDSDHDDKYDENEAIVSNSGDLLFDSNDKIIVPGAANSFDGSSFKYAAAKNGDPFVSGSLIVEDRNNDDIIEDSEIITPGTALLQNFSAVADRYADSNHNGRYDYKVFSKGIGEAIIVDASGNADMLESGEVKIAGYADLRTFDGTSCKYSDAGSRDGHYNYGELVISDINGDNKVDAAEIVCAGIADLKEFPANVMFADGDHDGVFSGSEAIILTEDYILQSDDKVLSAGNAGFHRFEKETYRFTDADHNGVYNPDEAIIVEANRGAVDDVLEDSDTVVLEGKADIESFSSDIMFLDDSGNSDAYENGEAIADDLNGNKMLDPNEMITSGRGNLKRFASVEKYIDGGDGNNARNSRYDQEEAIIYDGNDDGKLLSGALNGNAGDRVLAPGKAGLRNFSSERYVDANSNRQYDGSEDIYLDKDNNGVVTGDGDDTLKYFVVKNFGTAASTDLSSVKLWVDRDNDGQCEPETDDALAVKTLIPDAANSRIWYEGPATAPPLSTASARNAIGCTIPAEGQRFFVTADVSGKPTDGCDIQMELPLNGVRTLYGFPGPGDNAITNAYKQKVDFANPANVAITSPAAGGVVYGQVILRAEASDTVQIGKVEFFDEPPAENKKPIGIDDNGSPWEAPWDCSSAGFGIHTLYARAYDCTYLRPSKTQVIKHYKDSTGVPITVGISYSISLAAGWNLISTPVEPFNSDIASVLTVDGLRSIWSYNAVTSKWMRYDLEGPDFLNDLKIIQAGIGYWISMSKPGAIKIAGSLPQTAIPLQTGWNLVGFNSLKPLDAARAVSSISTNHPSVWTSSPGTDNWVNYDPDNLPNDLNTMEPGDGYWIHVNGDCIWNVGSQ